MTLERWRWWVLGFAATIAIVAVFFLFHAARSIFVPLVLALYLVLMLLPVHGWLTRHLPRFLQWLATPISALIPLAALAVAGTLLWAAAESIDDDTDAWQQAIVDTVHSVQDTLISWGVPAERVSGEALISEALNAVLAPLQDAVVTTFQILLGGLLVIFLMVLTFSERTTWRRKTYQIFVHTHAAHVFEILAESSAKVQVFLFWRTVTGLLSGGIVALVAWVLGVPLVAFWFLLQWLSNYIPTVGAIVAGTLPVLFALLTEGLADAAWMALTITAVEQLMGSFLGPKLAGRGLSLSPVAVLVSLLVFGWAWGAVGALLSAPILATVHVVARRVPELVPLAILIGRDPGEEPMPAGRTPTPAK